MITFFSQKSLKQNENIFSKPNQIIFQTDIYVTCAINSRAKTVRSLMEDHSQLTTHSDCKHVIRFFNTASYSYKPFHSIIIISSVNRQKLPQSNN